MRYPISFLRERILSLLPALVLASLPYAGYSQTDSTAVDTNPPESKERPFVTLNPTDQVPQVRAIIPMDGANVFFLNHRGQIGAAKFSPGLSQIGWDLYSEIKLNALPSLALGPNYSILTASENELTQAFDSDKNAQLDFFQALLQDWPGRGKGVTITAGPVADQWGRIILALSPGSLKEGEPARARLVAWHPEHKKLVTVTESELLIDAFAINRDGLVASRLHMADYKDGYFVSLTDLPSFDSKQPDVSPDPMPFTLPSLVIPAELTKNDPPVQLCFAHEGGKEKLLLPCPKSKHLIEILPEKLGNIWQGSILLRGKTERPVESIVEMSSGVILGGGSEGFVPLSGLSEPYRIMRITLAKDGVILFFNRSIDRFEGSKPENYSVKAIALNGGETTLAVVPVIESDGKAVILKTNAISAGTVLRVVCQNLPSEKGETLLSSAAFYTVHRR